MKFIMKTFLLQKQALDRTEIIAKDLAQTPCCWFGLSILYVVDDKTVEAYLIDVDRMRKADDTCSSASVGTAEGLKNLITIFKGGSINEVAPMTMDAIIKQLKIGKD